MRRGIGRGVSRLPREGHGPGCVTLVERDARELQDGSRWLLRELASRLERALGFPAIAKGERGHPDEVVCFRRPRIQRGRPPGVLERALHIALDEQPLALDQSRPALDRGVANGDIELNGRLGRLTGGVEQHRAAQPRLTLEGLVVQKRRQDGFGRLPPAERQVVVCQRQPVPRAHVGQCPQVRLCSGRTADRDVEGDEHALHR